MLIDTLYYLIFGKSKSNAMKVLEYEKKNLKRWCGRKERKIRQMDRYTARRQTERQ